MKESGKQAVVLLSGGLDSMVAGGIAREQGFDILALTIDYNQRHRIELESAARIAEALGAKRHVVLPIDLTQFGGSALTADIDVPKDGAGTHEGGGIPVTYVPARNTIFLSLCLGWAEAAGARDMVIGVNALDYSGYPDCRPEYIAAFEHMANLATRAGVEGSSRLVIHAPLQHLTKAQIVSLGVSLNVDYSLTTSCYDPTDSGDACGRCDACQLRLNGFATAGVSDPIAYAKREPA